MQLYGIDIINNVCVQKGVHHTESILTNLSLGCKSVRYSYQILTESIYPASPNSEIFSYVT